ncbi:hepcidin-like [Vanacampus margaritifer]
MKTFSLSVAVIIMLAFIFIQESCSFSNDNRDLDQHINVRDDAAAEIQADQSAVAGINRQKRHSGPCRVCCNCCNDPGFCGLCCQW